MNQLKRPYLPVVTFITAVFAQWLFVGKLPGISLLLFTIPMIVAFEIAKFIYNPKDSINKYHLLIIPLLFFASVFAFRTNEFVLFWAGTMYLLNGILYIFLTSNKDFFNKFSDLKLFILLGNLLFSFSSIFNVKVENEITFKNINTRLLKQVLIGGVITIPVVIVITSILASADEIFSNAIGDILNIFDFTGVNVGFFPFVLIASFIGWSYIYGYINRGMKEEVETEGLKSFIIHSPVIPAITTYSLSLIYTLFIYIQFRSLFGGEAYVQSQGLIYAEYAIKGFNQMMTVVVLNFIILYLFISRMNFGRAINKIMLYPSFIFIIFSSFVMLVSSVNKIMLYEFQYGYTVDRLIPHSFIFYLAAVLILISISIVIEESQRMKFTFFGGFILTNIYLIIFCIFPMEKFVVHKNVELYNSGQIKINSKPDMGRMGYSSKNLDMNYLVYNLSLEGFNQVMVENESGKLDTFISKAKTEQKNQNNPYSSGPIDVDIAIKNRVDHFDNKYGKNWQSWNVEYAKFNRFENLINVQ